MKRLFTLLLVLLITSASAQEFMGVPVQGTAEGTVRLLMEKGFVKKSSNPTSFVLSGKAGTQDALVVVAFTPITHTTWKIMVAFDDHVSWSSLKAQYLKLEEILIEKYGKPEHDYKFFTTPYKEGDGYELTAMAVEKGHYSSFFSNGIWIEISGKCVNIHYENRTNAALLDAEQAKVNARVF